MHENTDVLLAAEEDSRLPQLVLLDERKVRTSPQKMGLRTKINPAAATRRREDGRKT